MTEKAAAPVAGAGELITHPEEMLATASFRVGDSISAEFRARITPAGVICTGLAVSAIIASIGYARRRGRWLR
jgi:hypothetical protein